MSEKICLSVIIPSHNNGQTIGKTLPSVFSSLFEQPLEIIVIDDSSTDDSVTVAKRHNVRIYKNKIKQGPAFCRNFGAIKSRGQLLLFLDADVILRKGVLKNLFEVYQKIKTK